MRISRVLAIIVLAVVALGVVWWFFLRTRPGTVKDEALLAGRTAESLAGADEDYFHAMDNGVSENPEAVRIAMTPFMPGITTNEAMQRFVIGRNNWNVWSGGNDRLWDKFNGLSFGTLDLLKTVSGHPKMKYGRRNRWRYLGLVNEPCFQAPKKARADRYGLWLDERKPGCGPDPFENEAKYRGVKFGARGKNMPVGSYYGYASGVLGLRLFPNPAFDEEAQKHWDAERYYTDPSYYNDKSLVKPYRVGMSCGFCHISHNPTRPPANPEEPEYTNLSSNPGAQYFWVDRIFVWNPDERNFAYQLFHTSKPGALDTSLVSSDQINNPRTMNAVYNLPARMEMARRWHEDQLCCEELNNKQFNDYPFIKPNSVLRDFYVKPDEEKPAKTYTPRVLKDGSDSVGALGALNRVYINIGLFSEEWLLHFLPILGGPKITPIRIADAQKNSSYWNATEAQTPDVALFFLASAKPDLLRDAPNGASYINQAQADAGKKVFVEYCARCHSSLLPDRAYKDFFKSECNGPNYLKCWNDYWQWTKTAEFKQTMSQRAAQADFDTEKNAFTTDVRIPVTLLETNACSPLATNALDGDIWSDFASQSYKNLPAVGKVRVQHPVTGAVSEYEMPGGGRGYTRPPSLVSVWSTAPFLLNNELGEFHWRGDVPARMASFDDSIRKLLWPELREGAEQVLTRSGLSHPGKIDRLPEKAYLITAPGYFPGFLQWLPKSKTAQRTLPNVFADDPMLGGTVKLGPFPKGTPISLVSNINLQELLGVAKFGIGMQRYLESVDPNDSDEETARKFAPLVPQLLEISKCRDYIVNKGHYFGTQYLPPSERERALTDAEKLALIEYLKTL